MAAVEVDGVGSEVALQGGWQGLLASVEAERRVEAGEGDVWMVRTVFRRESAAGHCGGYGCLEVEERAGGFGFGEEDACSWEGVQAGEFYLKRREIKLGEFVFYGWECGFGDFA